MDDRDNIDRLLSADLRAEIEAIASVDSRSAREVIREAVESYLLSRRETLAVSRTPQEAGRRILERRKFHPLPPDTTLREMTTFGRA